MANTQYMPFPTPITPNAAQAPWAGWNWMAQGEQQAAQYGFQTTPLIKRDIFRNIISSVPSQYNLLPLLFNQGIEYTAGKEFTWFEKTWNRIPIYPSNTPAGGATQTVTTTSTAGIGDNAKVNYFDGSKGIVQPGSIVPNTSFIVNAMVGDTLPAINAGEYLTVDGYTIADGMNYTVGYDRLNVVEYNNRHEYFQRTKRWTREEIQINKNSGTTDYYDKDIALMMEEIYQDAMATFVNGSKGYFNFTPPGGSGPYWASTTDGFFKQMVHQGAQHMDTDPTNIAKDFEYLAFNTNYQNVGEPRVVLCTDKMWYQLSCINKSPIRYTPQDKTFDMGLDMYMMGTMKFIPMIIPQFEARSYMYEPAFANRIIVMDMNRLKPQCMRGYEPFEFYTIALSQQDGGREDYTEWMVRGCLGSKLTTAQASFWMDGIGF